jgi:hypothetical protein
MTLPQLLALYTFNKIGYVDYEWWIGKDIRGNVHGETRFKLLPQNSPAETKMLSIRTEYLQNGKFN